MKTLNLGCGSRDTFGTDKLDKENYNRTDIEVFDLDSKKPLPYKDNTFDEIRFYEVIQLLKYPQEILSECYRILKPLGILDITTLNQESVYWVAIQKLRDKPPRSKQYNNNGHTLSIFNETMIKSRLKAENFKIIDVRYFDRLNRCIRIRAVK